MHRICGDHAYPLFDTAATRRLEAAATAQWGPHTLMQRAGCAVARLAQALAPHARTIWLACGSGNNGGDGLEAAMQLRLSGRHVVVSWLGTPHTAAQGALLSWERARDAGVVFSDLPPPDLCADDLCVDALLGIGLSAATRPGAPDPRLQALLQVLHRTAAPVLCVDVPSGLLADTGQFAQGLAPRAGQARSPRHTLSVLTLHPGLFTADGRDAAGSVWFDDLGMDAGTERPCAHLFARHRPQERAQNTHKGSYGDVAVVGGEGLHARGRGMTGAALLAASAALHAGAGRVMVSLLDEGEVTQDIAQPECMLRRFDALPLHELTAVCGCGGGQAVRAVLPTVMAQAMRLVLDADALNAIAADTSLQHALRSRAASGLPTVLTPHPLEAARMLGADAAAVQADRLAAIRQLVDRFECAVVLKGSGSIVAAPGHAPRINRTGNARLATGGTGDVLAGLVGALLARMDSANAQMALDAALLACEHHGQVADDWPAGRALTASALARRLCP